MSASAGKRARKQTAHYTDPSESDEEFQVKPKRRATTKKGTKQSKPRSTKAKKVEVAETKKEEGQERPVESGTVGQGPTTTTTTTETTEATTTKSTEEKPEQKESTTTKEAEEPATKTEAEKAPQESKEDRWLEKGHIYFFYRPKVEHSEVHGLDDVQRFYMLLVPKTKAHKKRLIIVTRKRMPDIHKHNRFWGFVDKASDDVKEIHEHLDPEHYSTKTRGERDVPPARPAGEGFYGIIPHEHSGHTHLAYFLELPHELGEVQKAFNIEKEGSYIIAVKNPTIANPPEAGLQPSKKVHYPPVYQEKFHNKRWIPANPPDLLDYDGTEMIIIGAKEDIVAELRERGEELQHDEEEDLKKLNDNSLFQELRISKGVHPPEPLLQGIWK